MDVKFNNREVKPHQLRATVGSVTALLLILILGFTSWVTIGPEEAGVVLRFGAYSRSMPSGLHFKIPFGVERVIKVPVERQLKEEFGFRTARAAVRTRYESGDYSNESLMMTGDLNLASVEWIVQYRIQDPYNFLFKMVQPEQTLRHMTEAVMRQVIGDRSVNEVLTFGRQEISAKVKVDLQDLCTQYENGIRIEQVVLQDVNPPDPVKPAFNEVNEAQQERERLINQARAEYNQVIPRARGEAEQTVQQAEGYATDRVNRAKGEAAKFNSVFTEYAKAPEVTRRRIYLETMAQVLNTSGRKVIMDEGASGVLPLMLFGEDGLQIGGKGGGK